MKQITTALLIAFLFCHCIRRLEGLGTSKRIAIAHRILFSGIDTERTKYDREQYNAGKKIYFDPVMTFRPTISFKGKKFENRFGKNASNALLIEKYLSEKYPLVQ